MTTRIKGLDSGSIGSSSGKGPVEQIARTNSVNAVASGSSSPSNSDSVSITDSARQLASLSQAVEESPDMDNSRVAALRQAIESGQYTVNPGRIADGLIKMDQALGAASK